jgi:SAM-dependent methyltransferase
MVEYLERLDDEGQLSKSTASFLDLGTGNGHLLFALRDDGWNGKMLGLDYSQVSIDLARKIEESRKHSKEYEEDKKPPTVEFRQHDILEPSTSNETFNVLLDKGTFDAISLSAETDANGNRKFINYRRAIKPMLTNDGIFIITSCNWTEEELKKWFLSETPEDDGVFVLRERLKYPTFRFGGQDGQTVVTLVFQKKSKG